MTLVIEPIWLRMSSQVDRGLSHRHSFPSMPDHEILNLNEQVDNLPEEMALPSEVIATEVTLQAL